MIQNVTHIWCYLGSKSYYVWTNLTCLEEAELQCVLGPIWLRENGWCTTPCLWMLEVCASFLKAEATFFGADPWMHTSALCATVARPVLCSGGCTCAEVCLLVLTVCASLWALLSKAFRRLSSIFLCCSTVSWLDMLHSVAAEQLKLTSINYEDLHFELANNYSYLQTSDPLWSNWHFKTSATLKCCRPSSVLHWSPLTVAANGSS